MRGGDPSRYSSGFSLFELVVFIISVAIIYAFAANRFAEFPAEAERANFLAITTQLQSAINLEMMMGISSGRQTSVVGLEGANPMDLLLKAPSNYLGAFGSVDSSQIERRSWYFDLSSGELVYLINSAEGVFLQFDGQILPTSEIRFKIQAAYGDIDTRTGLPVQISETRGNEIDSEFRQQKFKGLLLEPTVPYIWEGGSQDSLMAATTADSVT